MYIPKSLWNDVLEDIKRMAGEVKMGDVKDANNFAMEKKEGGVEVYHNGEKVKEFGDDAEIATSSLLYDDLFAVKDGGKFKFYKLDGSVAFEKEYEDVDQIFDMNHLAIVSEDGDNYYLIDVNGNKVGDVVAKDIGYYEGGYEAENSDGKYAILDRSGKPVTDFKYSALYYRSVAKPRNIWTAKLKDENYDVIDADAKKVIVENVKIESFYENYFTAKNDDGGTDYYTFEGVKFYTKEK